MVERTQSGTEGRKQRKVRRALWTVALVLGLSMILPLTGMLLTGEMAGQAVAQEQSQDEAAAVAKAEEQRREFWRQARSGVEGYTAVSGPEAGVLIQSGGDVWRAVREGPILRYGGFVLLGVLVALLLFHFIAGSVKLEQRSGRMITRWTLFERVIHWYTAILFIILAITGLSLLFGRTVLSPWMGKEAFAAFANVAKPVHDWLAVPFVIGLVLMMVPWMKESLFKAYDLKWFAMGGGYLDKSKHPPAGFVNAGEKVWYWFLFFGGIVLVVSGFFLLFPNFGWARSTMQLAHIAHAVSGIGLIAFSFAHMYLGTVGNEGSLEGMVSGQVDEAWAKAHHNLWYEEVMKHGNPKDASSGAGAGQPLTT